MKIVAWLVGAATLVATGAYVFIYLGRWEWHRALLVAMLFVAAEVGMATALLLHRVGRLAEQQQEAMPDEAVLARLRRAPHPDRFAWLERSVGRTNVFLTILLGGGIVVSGGAWLLDRLAGRTAGAGVDRDIAARLRALSLPEGGLVADEAELLARDRPYADDPGLRLLVGPERDGS